MNENVKVYKTSDNDLTATPLSREETIKWYCNEFGVDESDMGDVIEIDIDNENVMIPLRVLGDKPLWDEKNGWTCGDYKGNVRLIEIHDGEAYLELTLREEIQSHGYEITEPYIIAVSR